MQLPVMTMILRIVAVVVLVLTVILVHMDVFRDVMRQNVELIPVIQVTLSHLQDVDVLRIALISV